MSQVLGNKLTEGNAQVSDLSDPNRPISLADKFSQVYDAEWVDAYEELEKRKIIEVDIIKILADIVKVSQDLKASTITSAASAL